MLKAALKENNKQGDNMLVWKRNTFKILLF